jgi:hypothetical protein
LGCVRTQYHAGSSNVWTSGKRKIFFRQAIWGLVAGIVASAAFFTSGP